MSEKKSSPSNGVDDRTRNWAFIAYPESAPNNWRDIINEQHIPWVESPLHDKDVDGDGELKKAHWHILLLFDGKKSYTQIKEITDAVKGTYPQKVQSVRGTVRYMAHMDDPDKYQYDVTLIIGHGGADISEHLKPIGSSRYKIISEMMQYVKDNEIYEIHELISHARTEHFSDWFPLLCDNSTYIMSSFIQSLRHVHTEKTMATLAKPVPPKPKEALKIDETTGEILK